MYQRKRLYYCEDTYIFMWCSYYTCTFVIPNNFYARVTLPQYNYLKLLHIDQLIEIHVQMYM